ncbi:uncharacterized protein LOC111618083 isoform X1 [Centruroides sculpturatus]|uniref:uncharacterized protein LOC111618083 isoform X1 n=1 Tax=Centruroides sculpturatus TaxID=218467 RepID=UPI000C6CB136|nr:uncharacterized protein LOC111618083 isoform X1 [Centruroides sculpturatus]
MEMRAFFLLLVAVCCSPPGLRCQSYDRLGMLTDSLLREMMERMGGDPDDDYPGLDPAGSGRPSRGDRLSKDLDVHPERFGTRRDDLLGREPSIRDREYLEHSSLWGHQYVQGGAGEGSQRLKPDGSVKNLQVVKTDAVLPAYCNPPNPCPPGYEARDGCLEDFVNTAVFSREYQAAQECMCDTEHMFDCPGSTRENEIDALARSIQNEGLMDTTIGRIVQDMQVGQRAPPPPQLPALPLISLSLRQIEGQRKNLVAKKYFTKKSHDTYYTEMRRSASASGLKAKRISGNPYLQGEKLPVVAKKNPGRVTSE